VYHNGIVEQTGKNRLGPRTKGGRGTPSYLTRVVTDDKELTSFLSVASRWRRKKYPTMLADAQASKRVGSFKALSANGFLPGYQNRQVFGKSLSIGVLGPVVEPGANKQPRLRWLGSTGKTKNGHSVVLRLQYDKVSVLLGGDLNIPSEELLLSYHTGIWERARSAEDERVLVKAAQGVFESEIAKACHHGSADFTELYLRAVNPIATVISSGDNEPHSHPRADALGAFGKTGRGARPLIFSTELARSPNETIKHPNVLRAKVKELQRKARTSARAQKQLDKLLSTVLNRSIAVFGAINLRTNGKDVVMAQMLERSRGSKKWDLYVLERVGNGALRYKSKH